MLQALGLDCVFLYLFAGMMIVITSLGDMTPNHFTKVLTGIGFVVNLIKVYKGYMNNNSYVLQISKFHTNNRTSAVILVNLP